MINSQTQAYEYCVDTWACTMLMKKFPLEKVHLHTGTWTTETPQHAYLARLLGSKVISLGCSRGYRTQY